MFRVAFLTIGLTLAMWGSALFVIEEVALTPDAANQTPLLVEWLSQRDGAGRAIVHPPEWLPFTCLGVGSVTMLYAIALPRRSAR